MLPDEILTLINQENQKANQVAVEPRYNIDELTITYDYLVNTPFCQPDAILSAYKDYHKHDFIWYVRKYIWQKISANEFYERLQFLSNRDVKALKDFVDSNNLSAEIHWLLLGIYYLSTKRVDEETIAFECLLRAREFNNAIVLYLLAKELHVYEYYRPAAKQGFHPAMFMHGCLLQITGRQTEGDEYLKAVEQSRFFIHEQAKQITDPTIFEWTHSHSETTIAILHQSAKFGSHDLIRRLPTYFFKSNYVSRLSESVKVKLVHEYRRTMIETRGHVEDQEYFLNEIRDCTQRTVIARKLIEVTNDYKYVNRMLDFLPETDAEAFVINYHIIVSLMYLSQPLQDGAIPAKAYKLLQDNLTQFFPLFERLLAQESEPMIPKIIHLFHDQFMLQQYAARMATAWDCLTLPKIVLIKPAPPMIRILSFLIDSRVSQLYNIFYHHTKIALPTKIIIAILEYIFDARLLNLFSQKKILHAEKQAYQNNRKEKQADQVLIHLQACMRESIVYYGQANPYVFFGGVRFHINDETLQKTKDGQVSCQAALYEFEVNSIPLPPAKR